MFKAGTQITILMILFCFSTVTDAGPYNQPGINGYIGSDFRHANPNDIDAVINPIFRGWATGYKDYLPSDTIGSYGYDGIASEYADPCKALGSATGNEMDVVSLGDLDSTEIVDGCEPGQVTLIFGDSCNPDDPNHIRNVSGYDFVVFENGFALEYTAEDGAITGEMFAEFGYVEVSSDGENFVRFPPVSLIPQPSGSYGYLTVDITNAYRLAGKHPNAGGVCTGTPFDLQQLIEHPDVRSGVVDINNISYVRIVDVPGSGDFNDTAVNNIDPDTKPNWDVYNSNNPIYDAWVTWGSGGLDLEAVGVLNEQELSADVNLDGIVDLDDFRILVKAWLNYFGEENWVGRCDLDGSGDLLINFRDFAVFSTQWQKVEQWRDYP